MCGEMAETRPEDCVAQQGGWGDIGPVPVQGLAGRGRAIRLSGPIPSPWRGLSGGTRSVCLGAARPAGELKGKSP